MGGFGRGPLQKSPHPGTGTNIVQVGLLLNIKIGLHTICNTTPREGPFFKNNNIEISNKLKSCLGIIS